MGEKQSAKENARPGPKDSARAASNCATRRSEETDRVGHRCLAPWVHDKHRQDAGRPDGRAKTLLGGRKSDEESESNMVVKEGHEGHQGKAAPVMDPAALPVCQ